LIRFLTINHRTVIDVKITNLRNLYNGCTRIRPSVRGDTGAAGASVVMKRERNIAPGELNECCTDRQRAVGRATPGVSRVLRSYESLYVIRARRERGLWQSPRKFSAAGRALYGHCTPRSPDLEQCLRRRVAPARPSVA
jgi:hypothetical protein